MKIKVHQDVYIGIGIIIFCAAFFIKTTKLPSGAAIFPVMTLGMLALLACWIVWDGFRKTKAEKNNDNTISLSKLKVPFITFLFISGYIALFSLTGYFIATIVFMVLLMRYFRMKSWKQILLISTGFIFIIYLMFVKQLNVPVLNFGYFEQVVDMLQ